MKIVKREEIKFKVKDLDFHELIKESNSEQKLELLHCLFEGFGFSRIMDKDILDKLCKSILQNYSGDLLQRYVDIFEYMVKSLRKRS